MEQTTTMTTEAFSNKRPRSPTADGPLRPAKIPRTQTSQVQINYLARHNNRTLPIVSANDFLPEILRLIGEYEDVLVRQESLAVNLGACPLGPILLNRFERLFDGPPRILKSHGREATITWLDVVEFAQNKPEQFNLEKTRNGVRVCQFYTKQCRVEISEEDYVLIASGIPQKMIPPQPILEDEEKEVQIIDMLDTSFGHIIHQADQVSGRARQLCHRLRTRRSAILNKRESDKFSRPDTVRTNGVLLSPVDTNGMNTKDFRSIETSQSPPSGFTAVNMRPSIPAEVETRPLSGSTEITSGGLDELFPNTRTQNVTIINGQSIKNASPTRKAELVKQFLSQNEQMIDQSEQKERRSSFATSRSTSVQAMNLGHTRSGSMTANIGIKGSSAVAIPNTPASLLPQIKSSSLERDDGGPFKAEMVTRMEVMHRGQRILPPCDRCRRLHMDCLKNLTACIGCTKKHAKCSWKDVQPEELQGRPSTPDEQQHKSNNIGEAPPLSAGSTIEVFRASDDNSRPSTGIGRSQANDIGGRKPSDELVGRLDSTILASPDFRTSVPKFDVRPPPMNQSSAFSARRESSRTRASVHNQAQVTDSGIVADSTREPRHSEHNHDEGDRLEALATQVYRSASQNAKSPD